jgi:histidine triad (HIT) family protein
MGDCIFCKIVEGSVPSTKVYEDKNSLAFMDIMPATKGHTLVIPKQHYETFLDIPKGELVSLIRIVQNVTRAVVKAVNANGYKIEMFNGEASGQSVKHAHFHIVPRYENDGLECRADKNWWAQKRGAYSNGEIEEYAEKIRRNYSGN